MIRVFLVDDHEVVTAGVRAMLEAEGDITVVGHATEADAATAAILDARPDIAVLDVRIGSDSGIDLCADLTQRAPDVRSIMLTAFNTDQAVVAAADAGAAAFVIKQIRSEELIEAIRAVASGRRLLDDATVRMARRRMTASGEGRLDQLSPQERRIFFRIGDGSTNREIAQEMFLAEKTVKNYVSNVLAKLGMARRTEAAALAARLRERDQSE